MNRYQALTEQIAGLRRYARALTGDAWAADDLVQDTLERACSRWVLWRAGSDLRAWLFTVMHNLHVSDIRRRVRHGEDQPLTESQTAEPVDDPALGLDTAMDLQRALMHLPDEQRAVLLLVTLEDMSYREAAQVLGVPLGTVMSRLSRARTRLQVLLQSPSSAQASTHPPVAPTLRRLK